MSDRYQGSLEEQFKQQARQAKRRGIGWQLTFDEWLSIWTESGHLHERGNKQGQYVMGRTGDTGPYAAGNVYICTFAQNLRDARINNPAIRVKKVGTGRGWTLLKRACKKPYQVMVGDKYIGCFATEAEAESAYQAACEVLISHAFIFRPTRSVRGSVRR
jgi:hypothetical protein